MEVYTLPYTIKSRDVNMFQHLRTSQLFEILQEAATDHSEMLGTGISVIRQKNLMWVLARQNVEIKRMPIYGENIIVETWPGSTVHSLYPRYYRIVDSSGRLLIESSAIWILADLYDRGLVPSSRSGFEFSFDKRGFEIPLPSPTRHFFTDKSISFTVPFSYIDMNGHMNNARYYDLAENLSPSALAGRNPVRLLVEYSSELMLGESYDLYYGQEGEKFYLRAGGDRPPFRLIMDY